MDNSSTNKNSLSGMLMLALCAFIWGTAFIAQSVGGEYAEPLTFNCSRSFWQLFFSFAAAYCSIKWQVSPLRSSELMIPRCADAPLRAVLSAA